MAKTVSSFVKSKLIPLLESMDFNVNATKHVYSKTINGNNISISLDKEKINYPKEIKIHDETTCNFSHEENFVVLECVCQLLRKGYNPRHIELEPRWKLGHQAKGGKADILIRDNSNNPLIIIECKTTGKEFQDAWRDTLEDGAQLFSYFQQEKKVSFLCLYTSGITDSNIRREYFLINVKDNEEYLKAHPSLKSYKSATNNKELFEVWSATYQKSFSRVGLLEEDISAYSIGKNNYTVEDLKEIDSITIGKKYNEFATILRQHNVSGHENAFDKLVNLFLAKVVDEKHNPKNLSFYWKGMAYDDIKSLTDRLQKLYQMGMKEFLQEDVTYIEKKQIEKAFRLFKKDPDATKTTILDYFDQLKYYTNNDFAFIDVHNKRLFYQNAEILLKIVQMLQDIKLQTQHQNQFLGDLFEGFLDKGVKQSEGQFFTPLPIVKFLVSSLPIEEIKDYDGKPSNVIDYACGAGHFLNEYAHQVAPLVKDPTTYYKHIYGVEKEYRLSKVAKVSAFMYGQDDINIIYNDALSNIPEIKDGSFRVLIANPPFSVKGFLGTLNKSDRAHYTLSQHVSDVIKNGSIECFFVERAQQLLQEDGVAAIILPSPVLTTNNDVYIVMRELLLKNFDIIAIARFGKGTFGATNTETITLFMRRKGKEPNLAEHVRNRVNAWMNNDFGEKDEVFEDKNLLEEYCRKQKISFDDYMTLLQGNPSGDLLDVEMFQEYRETFEKTAEYKKAKNDVEKETTAWVRYLQEIESDKLFYFIITKMNPQQVLVIRSPQETDEMKQFLGYEWSNRKGGEGIKDFATGDALDIKKIKTPLFNPEDYDDKTKINTLIRCNFQGNPLEIDTSLQPYVSYANLEDMLDFDRVSFDKEIKLNPPITIKSSYPLVLFKTLVKSNPKSSIQVGQVTGSGKYKFFTSGEDVLSHNEKLVDGENIYMATGGVANVFYYNGDASYSTDTFCFTTNAKVKTYFMYLLLQVFIEEINNSYFAGKGLKHLQKDDLAYLKLPIPANKEIQEKVCSAALPLEKKYAEAIQKVQTLRQEIDKLLLSNSKKTKYNLSDKTKFDLQIGRRILKRELSADGEGMSVYSANVYVPFGHINKSFLKDFDNPSIIWGIDGNWMVNYIPENIKFCPTDHCGVLRVLTKEIAPRYLVEILKNLGKEVGFTRTFRASLDDISKLSVHLPSLKEQLETVKKLEVIEKEIQKEEEILSSIRAKQRKILIDNKIIME